MTHSPTVGRQRSRQRAAGSVLGLVLMAAVGSSPAQTILSERQVAEVVTIVDLRAKPERVSGLLVNRSARTLRDVRLMIRYGWIWHNERAPGEDNPGRTDYYVVPEQIPPHGEVSFDYRPSPPLPRRTDGRFRTLVEVVGFTEVGL